MAKVIDLRGSGGQLIILGEVLALPQSSSPIPPNNVSYMAGCIRFNPQTNAVEYLSGDRSWRDITNNNIERVVTITTNNYTVNGDGTYYRISTIGDATIRVPPASEINFPLGSKFRFTRTTTSEVNFIEGSGVRINSPYSFTIEPRWGTVSLTKVSLNEWDLSGDCRSEGET